MGERKAFVLRMSPELWDEVQRMAGEELRSVNAQIEYLLREALRRRGRPKKELPPVEDETDSPA